MKKVAIIITILIIGVLYLNSPKNIETISVDTISPKNMTIYDNVICKGNIISNTSGYLSSNNSGEIIDIYVSIGQNVKKGDKIVDIRANNIKDMENELLNTVNLILDGEIDNLDNIQETFAGENDDGIMSIYAVEDGTIMQIFKEVGDYINAGVPFIKISDISDLKVLAKVPESKINDIKLGMKAQITGEAFPDRVYYGEVIEIMPYAKTNFDITGQKKSPYIEVIIKIENKELVLKPGFSANVKIVTNSTAGAKVVPYETVLREDGKQFVFVANDDKIVKQEVITGYEIQQGIQIKYGISADDSLVLNPTKDMKNGAKVDINE